MEIVKESDVIAAFREHTPFVSPKVKHLQVFFKEVTCLKTYRNNYPYCKKKDVVCFIKGEKYRLFIGRFPKTGVEGTETCTYVFVPGKQEFYVCDEVFGKFEDCPDVYSCIVEDEKFRFAYIPGKGKILVPDWLLSQAGVQKYMRQKFNNNEFSCFPVMGFGNKSLFIGWEFIQIKNGKPEPFGFLSLYNGDWMQRKFKVTVPICGVSIKLEGCTVYRDGDVLRFLFI